MTEETKEQFEIYPLHKYPQYRRDCMLMLNNEWPKSETLRYRFLDASCDDLPTCLVLVFTDEQGSNIVVGHAKLTVIYNEDDSVFIESVLVHHDYRGRGFGRVLMSKCEEYAAALGFKTMVLNTKLDGFYSKLGYKSSEPVCLFRYNASRALAAVFKCKFSPRINGNCNIKSNNSCDSLLVDKGHTEITSEPSLPENSTAPPSPPPPPPPPPPKPKLKPLPFRIPPFRKSILNPKISNDLYSLEDNVHIFMRKIIA